MWGYGMGYGGGMFFWWIGGLLLFAALMYSAVRIGTRRYHRDYHDYDNCGSNSRDCRDDDRHHYRRDDRYRRDDQ
jgi:hypothetical protein